MFYILVGCTFFLTTVYRNYDYKSLRSDPRKAKQKHLEKLEPSPDQPT